MSRAAARPHVVAITLLPGSQETAGLSVNLQYLVEDILKPLAEELNVVYYIVLRHCMVLVELDGASTSYSLNLLVNRLMKQGLHVEFVEATLNDDDKRQAQRVPAAGKSSSHITVLPDAQKLGSSARNAEAILMDVEKTGDQATLACISSRLVSVKAEGVKELTKEVEDLEMLMRPGRLAGLQLAAVSAALRNICSLKQQAANELWVLRRGLADVQAQNASALSRHSFVWHAQSIWRSVLEFQAYHHMQRINPALIAGLPIPSMPSHTAWRIAALCERQLGGAVA